MSRRLGGDRRLRARPRLLGGGDGVAPFRVRVLPGDSCAGRAQEVPSEWQASRIPGSVNVGPGGATGAEACRRRPRSRRGNAGPPASERQVGRSATKETNHRCKWREGNERQAGLPRRPGQGWRRGRGGAQGRVEAWMRGRRRTRQRTWRTAARAAPRRLGAPGDAWAPRCRGAPSGRPPAGVSGGASGVGQARLSRRFECPWKRGGVTVSNETPEGESDAREGLELLLLF